MSMGHVILKEFFVDRQTTPSSPTTSSASPTCRSWSLSTSEATRTCPESSSPQPIWATPARAPRIQDRVARRNAPANPVVPNGSLGHRFTRSGEGRWNLDLHSVDPLLTVHDSDGDGAEVEFPRFDTAEPGILRRGVPTRIVAGKLVTTVFDLLLAQYGVHRPGLPGSWPTGYDDADAAVHPGLAGADHRRAGDGGGAHRPGVRRQRRALRRPVDDPDGRGHQPLVSLRPDLPVVPGAGDAHRLSRASTAAAGRTTSARRSADRSPDGRRWHSAWTGSGRRGRCRAPCYWYLATDQWRYDPFTAEVMASPLAEGRFAGRTAADNIALASRLGWMPSYPTFNRNPLDLADEAAAAGQGASAHVVDGLTSRPPAVRLRGSGRAGELPALPDGVAVQPARLVRQGQRVLPAPPAGYRLRSARLRPGRGAPASRSPGATRPRSASSTC